MILYYLFIITCMEFFGIDDNKSKSGFRIEIGMFMLAISMLLYALGVLFLFRRSLILVSNVHFYLGKVLFFVGLYFFIGVTGIIKFFTKKGKIQGSAVYFIGLSIIVIGFTFVGTVVQLIGLFIIFRSFLPDFYDYLCRLPYVGSYLSTS